MTIFTRPVNPNKAHLEHDTSADNGASRPAGIAHQIAPNAAQQNKYPTRKIDLQAFMILTS